MTVITTCSRRLRHLQQLRDAIPAEHTYRFLIHDRDAIFSRNLDQRVRHLGLRVLKTPARSPQANALCKRLHGTLLVTLDDYEAARVLLEPIFAAISTEGVTKAVLETVGEIAPDEEISESQLARRIQLSKTATHERVKRALAGGWLVNREERKGYAAKLARGTPLPEDRPILPTKADPQPDPTAGDIDDNVEDDVHDPLQPTLPVDPPGAHQDITSPNDAARHAHSRELPGEALKDEGLNDAMAADHPSCSTVLVDVDVVIPSPPSRLDSSPPAFVTEDRDQGEDRPLESSTVG